MQLLQWMQPSKCKWIFHWLIPLRILTAGLPYPMSYDEAFIISNTTGEEWQLLKVYFFQLQSYKYQKKSQPDDPPTSQGLSPTPSILRITAQSVQISPISPKTTQTTGNGKQDGGLKRHLLFLFAFFFHLSETIPFFLPLLLTHDKDHVCLYLYGEQQQGMNLECFMKGCQSKWVRLACNNISLFHTHKFPSISLSYPLLCSIQKL